MLTKEIFLMLDNEASQEEILNAYPELSGNLYLCYKNAYRVHKGIFSNLEKEKEMREIFDLVKRKVPYKKAILERKMSISTYTRYTKMAEILSECDEEIENSDELSQAEINDFIEPVQLEVQTELEDNKEDVTIDNEIKEFLEVTMQSANQELEDLLSDFELILTAFKKMNYYVRTVKSFYDDIGIHNINQQTILHKCENATDLETFNEASKQLFELRKKRRVAKERYGLAYTLLLGLKRQKIHTGSFFNIINPLQGKIENIRNFTPDDIESKETLPTSFEQEDYENNEEQTSSLLKQEEAVQVPPPKTVYVCENKEADLEDWKKQLKMITNG